jgi:phosphopentomutase
MIHRVIIIVLDSVGIGNAPDAAKYGDEGANTLVNMSNAIPGGLQIPALQSMGLGNILKDEITGCPSVEHPLASYGRMIEKSKGKDTTIGHWEMAGIITQEPFPTFPDGFDIEFMKHWATVAGVEGWLHNKPASGTEIIKKLGELHVESGLPIVYTSADSVFQVAAHEEHFGLDRLYHVCEKTRVLVDPLRVGRVIARPFVGETADTFVRTANRHDYSLKPPEPHVLTLIRDADYEVLGIGKIYDIFAGSGITRSIRSKSNREGMDVLLKQLDDCERGLIFVNLVEFDMLYGHRRDPAGYAKCLHEFDLQFAEMIPKLKETDLLMITADHGLDPTFRGTDHTREMVPILSYNPGSPGVSLGTRDTFADMGVTACAALGVPSPHAGKGWEMVYESLGFSG